MDGRLKEVNVRETISPLPTAATRKDISNDRKTSNNKANNDCIGIRRQHLKGDKHYQNCTNLYAH